ncbi:THADA/TRM732, DUF2428 [Dillenia turbinata]|uniref:THADA/TRM732, DUF2428 n=1 Tax=Dillenia turbinata TaxID=194707 RepID=A0AAN8UMF8_9MAGN
MSAKWRALQHKHRYTYNAVIFPQNFINSLNLLPSDSSRSSNFVSQFKTLTSLNSTYSQVNHAKNVASAFSELLSSNCEETLVLNASKLYLEVLFLENSLPLHRTLVSVLAKNRNFHNIIAGCFRKLCEEYGGGKVKGKRFCVSRVALSMMSSPKLGYLVEIVEECAVLVGLDIVYGLNGVVLEVKEWSHPSPIVMEQCQEALSCLYYLLQKFPAKFSDSNGFSSGSSVREMSVEAILTILKSNAFSRDCLVAAGVSFCAALQAYMSPQELGLYIMRYMFNQTSCSVIGWDNELDNINSKTPFGGGLYSEIQSFSVLSRLCLLRGILTAGSRPVLNILFAVASCDLNAFHANGIDTRPIQTILYDAILPELCHYCENPSDSHFNFHALTVLQICLQQIKTSMLAKLLSSYENYNPMPEDMGTRILRIIWNNLEDPLSQTVKQVHLIFDLFLDIQSTTHWSEGPKTINSLLEKIASDLLRLGPRCKGRYVPLASLTKRLGAKTILGLNANLLFQTVQAYVDDDVCCAATSFLKCFLENLRDECWDTDGIEGGYAAYRGHCLPPFLCGLSSGNSKLRSNLNTYALPVLLEVDVDSLLPMLALISVGSCEEGIGFVCPEVSCVELTLKVEQQVAVLISLLKVSRLHALIEGDIDWWKNSSMLQEGIMSKTEELNLYAVVCIKGIKFKVLVAWLIMALTHVDESLRVDAAELLFLNPKTASLPSHLEISLMKKAIPFNMRCSSTGFQMKWTSLFRKFFSRVRTALERQFKQGSWQPLVYDKNHRTRELKGTEESAVDRADELLHFMKWLTCFLFFSCYPSAPYERKIMAMELILIINDTWSIVSPGDKDGSISSESCIHPYNKEFTLPDSTLLLVGSIIDSWDRLRESSFRILLHFPTPLPGISNRGMVREVIRWAKRLVCSPRVRESDAGALTLRLVFRKYVMGLGWIIRCSGDVDCFYSHPEAMNEDCQESTFDLPLVEYLKSLIDWLQVAVEEGEKDLSAACRNSFVHGVLLTLRYTFEELEWNSDVVLSSMSEMRHVFERLLELIMRITSLALWVVSADAWYLPEDMDDLVDDDSYLLDVPDEMNVIMSSSDAENSKSLRDNRQSEQIVMVGCWLAMKEAICLLNQFLLIGTIIRKIPLPSKTPLELSEGICSDVSDGTDAMFDLKQLEAIGDHFLEVLLKMKHNGAIDKTRAGFAALCNRLLCSDDPRLCKLTELWMEKLMKRTAAKGQVVDDLLRRSAGIPAGFSALFLSEPEGTPKKLLPLALRWLLDVANGSLLDKSKAICNDDDFYASSSTTSDQATNCTPPLRTDLGKNTSKMRDEGVIPTVHAFNVLRAAFNDTNLATDTSGFSAEALMVSVRCFSSPYWEIRNSATLCFTALVRRMIGFLNVQKRESARRVLTGLEFFHRYPSLHLFIFNELKVATEFLGDGSEHSEANLAKVAHPSLCPLLILLSRLKPSPISSETGDSLDPFLFMPFIRWCSTQSNLKIRVLASRALTGLVSNEKLPLVLLNIASELPSMKNKISAAPALSCSSSTRDGIHYPSYNSIHGTLLQLSSLLDTNCRNLADVSKKDQILGDLIPILSMHSWIGSSRMCKCPALNCCFLVVLDHMLSIARTVQDSKNFVAIRSLLSELSSECLDVGSYKPSYHDPTIPELRKQAASSYFSCVFEASKLTVEEGFNIPTIYQPTPNLFWTPEVDETCKGFQEKLMLGMLDSSYEVRRATLKWLLQFLRSTDCSTKTDDQSGNEIESIHQWTRTKLQPTLMKLLAVEKDHKCTYYVLRILFIWNLLQFQKLDKEICTEIVYVGSMAHDSVYQFWDKLVSLYKLARHTKTKETLVCCMGICVRQFADLFSTCLVSKVGNKQAAEGRPDYLDELLPVHDCITSFIDLVEQHSSSSEPVNMRKAAAESMIASCLLEQAKIVAPLVSHNQILSENSGSSFQVEEASNRYACEILNMWFTCIKLLEDEDVGIRQRLALDVQKCFISSGSGRKFQTGIVPTQVEKVIELSFEFLSSTFGHWLEYYDHLAQWVLNAASFVAPGGDLVRRVFDKEIDNHHEEKLLISQICCLHLEKLSISRLGELHLLGNCQMSDFLQNWRNRFFQQLISFINDHIDKEGGVNWIGGIGNHKDAFLPLYGNLLGLYAISMCIFNCGGENGILPHSDIVELGRTIKPFLRNPLILNLYLLVVELHKRMAGTTLDDSMLDSSDDSIWTSFDPYFLLR